MIVCSAGLRAALAVFFLGSAAYAIQPACDPATQTDALIGSKDKAVAWAGSIVISPADIDKWKFEELEAVARACKAGVGNPGVVKFSVFTDEGDRKQTLQARNPERGGREFWLSQYKKFDPKPMAMVLLVGKTTASWMLKNNKVSENSWPHDRELLDVAIQEGSEDDPSGSVTFFVKIKSSKPAEDARDALKYYYGEAEYGELAAPATPPRVYLFARPDAWFQDNLAFPVGYRFAPKPEKIQFSGPTWECDLLKAGNPPECHSIQIADQK